MGRGPDAASTRGTAPASLHGAVPVSSAGTRRRHGTAPFSPGTATATCPPKKKKPRAAHREPTPQPRGSAFQAPGEHGPTQDKTKHIFAERPGRLSAPLPARRRGDGRTPGIFSRHSPREIAAKIVRGLHKAAEAFPTAQLRISAAPSPRPCPPHTIPNPGDPAGREQPDAGRVQPPYLGTEPPQRTGNRKLNIKMLHGFREAAVEGCAVTPFPVGRLFLAYSEEVNFSLVSLSGSK